MHFYFWRHIIRRCYFLALRKSGSFADSVVVCISRSAPITQKMQCGRFKVYTVNLGKNDIQDIVRKQKELADITILVIENPILSPRVREAFEKIQGLIIVRGSKQTQCLFNKMFVTMNPPLNDLRKSVRSIILYLLRISKYREEYFIQCRSKGESKSIASEFMNQSIREVDVAIAEAMVEVIKINPENKK